MPDERPSANETKKLAVELTLDGAGLVLLAFASPVGVVGGTLFISAAVLGAVATADDAGRLAHGLGYESFAVLPDNVRSAVDLANFLVGAGNQWFVELPEMGRAIEVEWHSVVSLTLFTPAAGFSLADFLQAVTASHHHADPANNAAPGDGQHHGGQPPDAAPNYSAPDGQQVHLDGPHAGDHTDGGKVLDPGQHGNDHGGLQVDPAGGVNQLDPGQHGNDQGGSNASAPDGGASLLDPSQHPPDHGGDGVHLQVDHGGDGANAVDLGHR